MIAWLDASSGISGDKFLGAVLHAGVPVDTLTDALSGLDISGWSLELADVTRSGLAAQQALVKAEGTQPLREWPSIRALIESADIPLRAAEMALDTFAHLANAEAAAHGIPPEEVHFHEVGAVDSILDIVGTCVGLELLGVTTLVCSKIAVGSGTVDAAHGPLPIPAPGTLALLHGAPIEAGGEGELTTPTGAALVAAIADAFGPMPPMIVRAVGLGAGSRETARPNIARLVLGDLLPVESLEQEDVALLATAVDHRTPEQLAFAAEQLLESGALDVWMTPIVMKKGRLGTEFSVLCDPEKADALSALVVRETGSLGVRILKTRRMTARRASRTASTSLGEVRVKDADLGGITERRIEHDDLAKIARASGLPLSEVARRLQAEVDEATGE